MSEGLRDEAAAIAGNVVLSDEPGQQMRAAREHHEFTQSWLAPKLGVRRESLSRIESGRSSPTLAVVERFARVVALARHVRDEVAKTEQGQETPPANAAVTVGRRLGLDAGEAEEIARAAIEAYRDKRRSLLEDIDANGGDRE
jgi:DNA-binding XRE family transcriptional regulator